MSVSVKEIIESIEDMAPLETQELWDNSGLQLGDLNYEVKKILIAMDITDKCVEYAIDKDVELILTHHPFLFSSLKSIDFNDYKGMLIKKLIENKITVYSFHTNLDKAKNGTNHVLANILGVRDIQNILDDENLNIGVFGTSPFDKLNQVIDKLSHELVPKEYIRIYGKSPGRVSKIAFLGGSGSSEIENVVMRGCEVFITSDVKYHDGQLAYENGLTLIDIGHFYSEFPVLTKMESILKSKYDKLEMEVFMEPVFIIEP